MCKENLKYGKFGKPRTAASSSGGSTHLSLFPLLCILPSLAHIHLLNKKGTSKSIFFRNSLFQQASYFHYQHHRCSSSRHNHDIKSKWSISKILYFANHQNCFNDEDEGEAANHLSAGSAAKKVGRGKQRFCQNQWYRWKHSEIKISSISEFDCICFATFAHFQIRFRIKLWSCQGTVYSCQKKASRVLNTNHRKFWYFTFPKWPGRDHNGIMATIIIVD